MERGVGGGQAAPAVCDTVGNPAADLGQQMYPCAPPRGTPRPVRSAHSALPLR